MKVHSEPKLNKCIEKNLKVVLVDVLEAILTRRSVREFAQKEVPDSVVETLLEAGMAGPTAKDERPCHFIVAKDKKTLGLLSKMSNGSNLLARAPLGIVVCGDLKAVSREEYCALDCSIAAQNILLEAHALGLGAVWVAIYPSEERTGIAEETLGIPETVFPLCVIAIGYPGEKKEPRKLFDSTRIHENKW
jgi:nitroreductase